MASPIEVLFPDIEDAPFRLAPERRDKLKAIFDEKNIQYSFDREAMRMRFEGADLFGGLGLVYVGVRGLEHFWALCYGAMHAYRAFQANGFQATRLTVDEEGRRVAKLLDWAVAGVKDGDPAEWPNDVPKPEAAPTEMPSRLANELFLGAAGFAVLHEVGHIVQDHRMDNPPLDVRFRYEFEADEWAYNWVMDNWRDFDPDRAVHTKRVTLLACLFAMMAINRYYQKERNEQLKKPQEILSHPNVIDRVLRFLIKHANEDSGLPARLGWGVAAAAIHMHFTAQVQAAMPKFEDFRAYFNSIRSRFD